MIYFGSAVVYYVSTLQKGVTLSRNKLEYVALSESAKVIMRLSRRVEDLCIPRESAVKMQNNAGAIEWAAGHPAEDFPSSKNIELRYHHVMEMTQHGEDRLEKVDTRGMISNCRTKPLNGDQMKKANEKFQLAGIRRATNTYYMPNERKK